jgi:hypothetical protein
MTPAATESAAESAADAGPLTRVMIPCADPRPVSPSPSCAAVTGGFIPMHGCRQQEGLLVTDAEAVDEAHVRVVRPAEADGSVGEGE